MVHGEGPRRFIASGLSTEIDDTHPTASQTITVQNNSAQPVTNVSMVGLGGPWSRTGGSCTAAPFTVPALGSCTLQITHTFNAVGPQSTPFSLSYASGTSNTFTLTA